ncbi:MAG: SH3 domain-containing protein [Dehalococcoidia bacterium]
MGETATGRWRRIGAVVVAAALALSAGGTLLAQSPPQATPTPTPSPGRTSTVLQPNPTSPLPPPATTPSPAPAPATNASPIPSPSASPAAAQPSQSGSVAVVLPSDGLNLREGPGTEFPSLALIPAGTELPILGEQVNGNWLPVSYQGTRGFVSAEFVQIRSAPAQGQPGPAQPTPAPSPTPAPTPRPAPNGIPAPSSIPAQFDNGILLQGVFASDIDEMITVADEFQLTTSVRPPDGVTKITMRLSGAPFLSTSLEFDVQPGADNWLTVPAFRVDTEDEPVLREELVRTVGGRIPIMDGALVIAVDYADASGAARTANFQPTVLLFNDPTKIAIVEYPDLKRLTGLPPSGAGAENYYLRGDADFHHPDDFYVRKLAVEAGRRGGIFPDNPELVADNVFTYINTLLGDGEPGDFNNDYNMARLIDDGTIKRGQLNGAYICIGQTYFMTALTRTLGMPSRELNIAVGKPNFRGNDGVWRVTWWQEGAAHAWYNGRWNHYDLWLGFKGMNGYFENNLAYQTWAAFNRQSVMFKTAGGVDTGLRGHDFNQWPGEPPQWEFVREASKPGVNVQDVPPENGEPVTGIPSFHAYRERGSALGPPPGPAIRIATPPASLGILNPPETRP